MAIAACVAVAFLAFSIASACFSFGPTIDVVGDIVFFVLLCALFYIGHNFAARRESSRYRRMYEGKKELTDALERAEAGERARRAIIANMSHEFRTPLNTVIGFAELLAEGETDPERKEMACCVQRGGWDLLTLVNGLVKAAELSGGGYSDRMDRFSLSELLAAVEATRGGEARAKGLELLTECSGTREFKGDVESISSILGILVGNAVKYSEHGPISISARELDVTDGGRILIECRVRDHGKGMPKRTVEKLFAPFEQGEDPLTKRYPGVGVGLYTAKRLSEAVRGDLRLESKVGVGTTAFLVVPLEADIVEGEKRL